VSLTTTKCLLHHLFFCAGCILPLALALPYPAVSNDQSNTLQTADGSGSPDISAVITVLPSHSPSANDPHAIAEAFVLFVLFTLIILAVYWFGPSLSRRLPHELLGRQPVTGPGFGFDGLTKAQLKAVRLKEKEEGMDGEWFIKLPARPPTIALKEFPLPPIQMPTETLGKSG